MSRKILSLLLCLTLSLSAGMRAAGDGSQQILDRAAAVFNGSKSLKATFTTGADGSTLSGTITLQGDKFRISSREYSTWYDGKTQWTYLASSNEVNVTEPTPDELTQMNPFIIVSTLRKAYNSTKLKSPAGTSKVRLTPKDPRHADIRSAEITFNDKTSLPTHIILDMAAGSKVDIKINSTTKGNILPLSTFIFNKKEFPGVEVIDLR